MVLARLTDVASNPERRTALADAGLAVLARDGARGLTHRAVDAEAGVPTGTTSNYFRSRDDLLEALVARIFERLAPEPEVLAAFARRRPSRARRWSGRTRPTWPTTTKPDCPVAPRRSRCSTTRWTACCSTG